MPLERLRQAGEALEDRLSRRDFLLFLAGSALTLTGCTSPRPTPRSIIAELTPFPEEIIVPGTMRFIKEINGLPESAIKSALVERVLPYYQRQAPFILRRGGLDIKVHSASIDASVMSSSTPIGGTFNFRGGSPPEVFHVLKDTALSLPLVRLVLDHEIGLFPKGNIATDGTAVQNIIYKPEDNIYEGVAPKITVKAYDLTSVRPENRERFAAYESFIYVKEACSMLLADILTEEMYKKIQKLGLPTHITVRRNDDSLTEIEVVNQMQTTISNAIGRYVATNDIAGYLVGLKAVKGTKIEQYIARDPSIQPVIQSVRNIDFENDDPRNLLLRAYQWAIATPEALLFPHAGNMQHIP